MTGSNIKHQLNNRLHCHFSNYHPLFSFSVVKYPSFFQISWAVNEGRACQAMTIITLGFECSMSSSDEWINDRHQESCYFGNWFVSISFLFFNFLFSSLVKLEERSSWIAWRSVRNERMKEKDERRERGEEWEVRTDTKRKEAKKEAEDVGNFQFYSSPFLQIFFFLLFTSLIHSKPFPLSTVIHCLTSTILSFIPKTAEERIIVSSSWIYY